MADQDDPPLRPDGHRHDSPETVEPPSSKAWDYALLGILVAVVMVLVVTGALPILDL